MSHNKDKTAKSKPKPGPPTNSILFHQIMSVLKLRLSIANIPILEAKLNNHIAEYLKGIDIHYIKLHFVNKIVEDIFNLFLKETQKEDTASSSLSETALSSITFNPSNKDVKWEITEPIALKAASPLTDFNINSKKTKRKQCNKINLPMKFSRDKEWSIPHDAFFFNNEYGNSRRNDIDVDAMNERIINQIMTHSSSS